MVRLTVCKWFRNKNKIYRMRGEGYCVSTRKNTDGEFEESAPRLMGWRCQLGGLSRVVNFPEI